MLADLNIFLMKARCCALNHERGGFLCFTRINKQVVLVIGLLLLFLIALAACSQEPVEVTRVVEVAGARGRSNPGSGSTG